MKDAKPQGEPRVYGLMAEFEEASDVVLAARKAYEAGYRKMDAYSPFPIEELGEALGHHHSWVPLLVLLGGITGCVSGFLLQYVTATIVYPVNIGGRPLNSWPAFIPPTFEMTILFAAGAAVFGMLALNKLPEPYHAVFNVPEFARASRDRFFLLIEAGDSRFDRDRTWSFLSGLGALTVNEVER